MSLLLKRWWWAIIPAGVVTVLAMMPVLSDRVPGEVLGGIFFIGLAHLIILGLLYPIYLYRRKYGTLKYWKDVGWIDYRPVARCRQCGQLQKLADAKSLKEARCEACGFPLAGE